jgi:hypothetical protein
MPSDDSPNWPLAYLITFRCYGTWLHGDARGSIDRNHNRSGTPVIPLNEAWERSAHSRMSGRPVTLSERQRAEVSGAINETASHRGWVLLQVNVRSNHLHAVVSAAAPGMKVVNDLKSWATRRLRVEGVVARRRHDTMGEGRERWSPLDPERRRTCLPVRPGGSGRRTVPERPTQFRTATVRE